METKRLTIDLSKMVTYWCPALYVGCELEQGKDTDPFAQYGPCPSCGAKRHCPKHGHKTTSHTFPYSVQCCERAVPKFEWLDQVNRGEAHFKIWGQHDGPPIEVTMTNVRVDFDTTGPCAEWDEVIFRNEQGQVIEDEDTVELYLCIYEDGLRDMAEEFLND